MIASISKEIAEELKEKSYKKRGRPRKNSNLASKTEKTKLTKEQRQELKLKRQKDRH